RKVGNLIDGMLSIMARLARQTTTLDCRICLQFPFYAPCWRVTNRSRKSVLWYFGLSVADIRQGRIMQTATFDVNMTKRIHGSGNPFRTRVAAPGAAAPIPVVAK
ncbi:MAG TPA: hypothetical protein VF816_00445, partial [Rhodocyclaceae bacterium]